MYVTAGHSAKAPAGASGSPVALQDMTVADQAPFLGVVLGHWAVLIGVPANGVKPTVTYEVAPGGALSQALGTIAAGVLHRAKPGYLSSMVAGSYFGGFDDDANEARRTFEATAPNPVTVAQQVNELVDSICTLTCAEEVNLATFLQLL